MSLKTFCLLASGILVIIVGVGVNYLFSLPLLSKSYLFATFIYVIIMWSLLDWFLKNKAINKLKPVSLIEDDGTMLYCALRNELSFYGCFRRMHDPLSRLAVRDLFRQYISLPVLMAFEEEKSFNLPFDYSLNFKIKNLRVNFSETMAEDTEPIDLFNRYGSQHRAKYAIKEAIQEALQATFDEAVKTENKQLVLEANLSANALRIIFLSKLESVLKKELYKYTHNNFDFSVMIKSI